MIKIGLLGKMASGKTEISNWFLKTYGGQRVAFADKLKEDVINYGLTPDGKIDKARDRQILQSYGQLRRGELKQFDYCRGKVYFQEYPSASGLYDVTKMAHLEISKRLGGSEDITMYIGPCDLNHWVNQAILKAEELEIAGVNVIIDDIRRDNEAQALKDKGFVLIKIDASDATRKNRLIARDGGYKEEALHDISESQIDSIQPDYHIDNNGDFEQALEAFRLIVTKMIG